MAYDIKAVKQQWEGYETPLVWGRYPVEHEPIRRHCHMLDDTNPRFLRDGHCPPVIFPLIARMPTPGEENTGGSDRRVHREPAVPERAGVIPSGGR